MIKPIVRIKFVTGINLRKATTPHVRTHGRICFVAGQCQTKFLVHIIDCMLVWLLIRVTNV